MIQIVWFTPYLKFHSHIHVPWTTSSNIFLIGGELVIISIHLNPFLIYYERIINRAIPLFSLRFHMTFIWLFLAAIWPSYPPYSYHAADNKTVQKQDKNMAHVQCSCPFFWYPRQWPFPNFWTKNNLVTCQVPSFIWPNKSGKSHAKKLVYVNLSLVSEVAGTSIIPSEMVSFWLTKNLI